MTLALFGIVAASPVLAAAALAVAWTSPGPILFRHERIGLRGRRFRLLKFRTMRQGASGLEVTAADDPRITRVGRLLRRTKLDELPQLWNLLRGDMSFVGPRPEVPRYVEAQDPRWREILSVRPGLTDPATVRFRDEEVLMASVSSDRERYYREVLLPAKLEASIAYLHERTWKTDLGVLLRTARRLTAGGNPIPRDR